MAAFALAHASYTLAFVKDAPALRLSLAIPFLLWGAGLLALLWEGLGPLALPVVAYATILMAMIWRASARVGGGGAPTRSEWAAAGGAILFGLSDSLIALDRFHAPVVAARPAILPLYWLGQWGIAASARSRDYS